MAKINVLTPDIFNLISAGEVVENPVGAVKELVENSIDAGAHRIVIEVEGGGFDRITVLDNGCGIGEDDLGLAFVKHATSKLECAEDLFAVQTLGFRGEALSSIAAVSKVKLTTRTSSADTGVSVSVVDGAVTNKQYVSCNVGTSIEIRDLFYNTPARKKFFKSPEREGAEISKFVARLILTNPYLEISYFRDGDKVYETKGSGLEEAIFSIYGADCLSQCIKVSFARETMMISGYIGTPDYTKPNRTYQTLSVNGRCVTDQNVTGAITQAFKPYLMTRRYPFFVLNLEIPFDFVDVNVHPKKTEVRFANPRMVCSAFFRAVANELDAFSKSRVDAIMSKRPDQGDELLSQFDEKDSLDMFRQILSDESLEVMNPGQSQDVKEIEKATIEEEKKLKFKEYAEWLEREVTVEKARKQLGLDDPEFVKQSTYILPDCKPDPVPPKTRADDLFDRTRILGIAFKTYVILEIEDKVIFVDQHAAHERILFDKFMAQDTGAMQSVMFPYVFTVKDDEAAFIDDNIDNIFQAGIEIEHFGRNTYRIVAVSTLLENTKMDEFVQFLLSGIDDFKLDDRALIVEKIAKKACKAAVKAGQVLGELEIKALIEQIYDNKVFQCPHGRPITAVFTKSQIEKMFKRIV